MHNLPRRAYSLAKTALIKQQGPRLPTGAPRSICTPHKFSAALTGNLAARELTWKDVYHVTIRRTQEQGEKRQAQAEAAATRCRHGECSWAPARGPQPGWS